MSEATPTADLSKPYQFPQFEYLVEDVFPTREVHIVAGPSGAGKSTWMLKFIDNWRQGQSFFGHFAHPKPFMYVSYDRSKAGVLRVFKRLGLDPRHFNIYVPTGQTKANALKTTITTVLDKHPEIKVFFIEGFATKVPDGKINDQKVVADFLTGLQELCEARDITIFGVMHTAKTKQDEKYENPRQRLSGTVAWAGYSETIIIVEPKYPDNPDDTTRTIMILPRNAPEVTKEFAFVGGILIEKARKKSAQEQVDDWLATKEPGFTFPLEAAVLAIGLPKTTVSRMLEIFMERKTVEKVKHGIYRLVKPEEKADA